MTNMLAPFVKIEENIQFYLNNRAYEIKENNIEIIERPTNKEFLNAITVFENFDIVGNDIKWYNKGSKFIYNIEEGTFHNGTSLISESFSTYVLASGLVRYENKNKAELFENLPTIVENFMYLDFATTFKKGGVTVDLFKLDESLFISRFNEDTKLSKFFKASANEAVSYVKEQTTEDASPIVIEMLEGEALELAKKSEEISKFEEMISFLKDQRGLLAEADKSIEEIKAADALINEEIAIWEDRIEYTMLNEGWLKQIIGYTFFLPLTLLNVLVQLTQKKVKIKKMLKNETDPKKKAKLKEQLKGMKAEEVKAKEKIEDQKAKMKDAADQAKGSASPEEKAKFAKKKKAMQDKLNKKKEELRKVQGQWNGLV